MNKDRAPLFSRMYDYKPLQNTPGRTFKVVIGLIALVIMRSFWECIGDEKDAQGLTSELSKEVEPLRNFRLVTGERKTPREMQQLDKLGMSTMLESELTLDGERPSRQGLPEVPQGLFDCKMKAKEKHQCDLWLETRRPAKGTAKQDSSASSWACFNTTCNAHRETDPVENVFAQNLKIKFYISSRSTSPSSHSGDESDLVQNKSHRFFLTSFTVPTKCHQCTSLMVGLLRQGCVCDACGFLCHTTCVEKVPQVCPVPSQQKKDSFCLDPREGTGTACEGQVWVPKKTGVKNGWQRTLAIVCDFKLFLYDINEEDLKPSVVVSQVIDMRDAAFSVCSLWPSDCVPIRRQEMTRMFQVTTSQLSAPSNKYSIPILADSENEKSEWVEALSGLHTMLKKNHSRDRSVYVLKEAYGNSLSLIKTTQAAAIIDHKRIALGNEEGLFVVHITIDEVIQIGDMKRIHQIELIPHGQIVAVISGRNHHVYLLPMLALDGQKTKIHKLPETRGCLAMASGTMCLGAHVCLCVARKSRILCFELFQSKSISHKKFKEVQVPTTIQWMAIFSEQLCVGFQSGFLRYPLKREGIPYRMLHSHDPTLSFIEHQPMDALCAVEISSIEYLLCFKSIGIYIDSRGLRSRPVELMWPATPTYCCYNAPYLSVYSENAVDIFDVNSTKWIQTIPLRKVRPLNSKGSLNLHLETIRLIYFKNKMTTGDELVFPEASDNHQKQMVPKVNSRRRHSFRVLREKGALPKRL
ncbi:serine/threonine-protein kinase MRCK alpha-like [Carlito syrichta]|uniref:Serine/threonine-protein kinase MRCK alpha-like n=1 Tax=Carlito syrichta TaxID=1868482 RepID=A0A3Q0DZZ0_CARSF|nr:serine/threonine-protein kinase MRCK alpha-like [Carlito syrichta]